MVRQQTLLMKTVAVLNNLRMKTLGFKLHPKSYLFSYEVFIILKLYIVSCLPICIMKLRFCETVYQNFSNSRLFETTVALLRLLNFPCLRELFQGNSEDNYVHLVPYLFGHTQCLTAPMLWTPPLHRK
jgi:hypothetical protein